MRFRSSWIAALLLSCALPAAAGNVRIGIVDMPRLFAEYPGTRAAQVRYEAVARERERRLAEDEKGYRAKKAEHDRRKATLDAAARKSAERELARQAREIEKRKEDYLAEMRDREERMSRDLVEEIRTLVAKAAGKRKLDLVLDKEKAVYVRDAVDLTPEILDSFKAAAEKDAP